MGGNIGGWTGLLPILFALTVWVLIAVLISWAIAGSAQRKGKSRLVFFWVSFLLFPIGAVVMGIIVATANPTQPSSRSST
jgi:hypothetical protein